MMSSTSDTDAPEQIRLETEDLARLLDLICTAVGLPTRWDKGLVTRLTTLHRGFSVVADQSEQARDWAQAISGLMDTRVAVDTDDVRQLTQLGVLLEQQPGNMPTKETRACLALASRAFATSLNGTKISSAFLDGLRQLFTSQAQSWRDTRTLLVEVSESKHIPDTTGLTDTCAKFIQSAAFLIGEHIYFPDLRPRSRQEGMDEYVEEADEGQPTESSSAKERTKREQPVFQTRPDRNLFEFQIVQQEHEPTLNSYRLSNDWNSLTNAELHDCSRILLHQLRVPSNEDQWQAKRLHAACRILSQLAQLSIEKLARLPIIGSGTMHLDLSCGLLKRDLMVIAPRTDRSTGQRWTGQWLQTPVPPEVLSVLRAAVTRHPESQTIGDLLIKEGLNPTKCHKLLNSNRTEPRIYDSLRVARSLRTYLLTGGIHAATVSRLLGDITIIPRAHHYYLSLDQSEIYLAINWWCEKIGLVPAGTPEKTIYVGSHKARSFSDVHKSIASLQQENHAHKMTITTRASLQDAIRFHNAFICRYTLQLNWTLGARCQNLSMVTVAMLLGDPDHIVMADRASDRYSEMRVCPLTSALKRSRLNLVEHLLAMSKRLLAAGENKIAKELETHANGTNPEGIGLPIIFKHKKYGLRLRPVTRADLKKVKRNSPVIELNEPRHFLITELDRRGVSSVAIDALVGHHQSGAPPFGIGSGISIKDFSSYIVRVLEDLHQDLKVEELAGLGRSDPNRKKLSEISLPEVVPLPSNRFLQQRIEIEDFNPPDLILTEEDCPVSLWTMPSLNKVKQLRVAHLQSDSLNYFPWGALCLCLVIFDFVITPSELRAFYGQLALEKEERIGALCGVEINDSQMQPIGQRLLSNWTVDAIDAGRRFSEPPTFEQALQQMSILIFSFDKRWPGDDQYSCLKRLQSLAAHASLFEVTPTARFGIFHKAPFIPLADLSRVCFGTSLSSSRPAIPPRSRSERSNDFDGPLNIIKKWANRDLNLGEYRQRANELTKELKSWSDSTELDDADQYFLDLVYAELSNSPPFRRLSLPVLHKYLQISKDFFEHVRQTGDIPRTREAWEEFLPLVMDKENADGPQRWVGLHIGAWLSRQGIAIPKELRSGEVLQQNYRPHLSSYVTTDELEHVAKRLPEIGIGSPWESWMSVYLKAARHCPLRPAELRFLRAYDVSSDGQHIHVQPIGHIHLKTTTSKGLISIPKKLHSVLLRHKERRNDSPAGSKAMMFAPSRLPDYSGLDKSISAVNFSIKELIGKNTFRMYDLRACAISDLIFDLTSHVRMLAEGLTSKTSAYEAPEFEARFKRCALAAREARQTNCLTALRYYNLGGMIEGRCEINQSTQDLKPSAKYVAAIGNKSAAAVYSQRYRSAQGAKTRRAPAHGASKAELQHRINLNSTHTSYPGATKLYDHRPIVARLLTLSGIETKAAADEAGISFSEYISFDDAHNFALIQAGISSIHNTATRTDSIWSPMIDSIAKWAFHHRRELKQKLTSLPRHFRAHGSKLSFRNLQSISTTSHLWAGLLAIGIQPIIFFSSTVRLSDRTSMRSTLQPIGIQVSATTVARQSFAAMRFQGISFAKGKDNLDAPSNHQMGKMGRLVVAAIYLALSTTDEHSS